MPFTQQQIDLALNPGTRDSVMFHAGTMNFSESNIYNPVMDYLTGRNASLPQLQVDQNGYVAVNFLNLLVNIHQPSPNDQLVLDVINLPGISRVSIYVYPQWLYKYALRYKEEKPFQAVISQFRKLGMNDDEIFAFFIVNLGPGQEYNDIDGTALKSYLVEHVRKAGKLIPVRPSHFQSRIDWSMSYFRLLEEFKPELANEYALQCIYSINQCPIVCFIEYKEGYYMPALLESLKNRQNPNLQTIQLKFSAALQLYEANHINYSEIAVELSQQYIEYLAIHQPKYKWESCSITLKEFADTSFAQLPYSSVAFHILMRNNPAHALEILKNNFAKKVNVAFPSIEIITYHLGKNAFPYVEMAMLADNTGIVEYRQLTSLIQKVFGPEQYLPVIWKLTANKSRVVKEFVADLLAKNDLEAETKAIGLLKSKSSEIRQTAALVLSHFHSDAATKAITAVLHKESNDNARDILLTFVSGTLPDKADENFIDEIVQAAAERGKLNKPIEPWLDENSLPVLFDYSGKELPTNYIRFLLYRMSRVKEMRSDPEAKYIIELVDKKSSNSFAMDLLKKYIDTGAKPEHKYLLAIAALLGNDQVVDKMRMTINKWIDENRYKMAENGVGALALHGSDKALRWVEWYSRKYKSKKANVGAAALAALETAAEELGITTHELGDRVVPDFGFEGLFKQLTIAGQEYRAFIDSNFKLAFFDDDNRKLKSIPAGADPELKEEFKSIGKEVRDVVRSQSSRLEYYLIIQRKWKFENWQHFFLNNPVMFIYATKLLWGVYDNEHKLLQSFLCYEDTSIIDISGEEICISPDKFIGIVHPSQLDTEALQTWQKQFFDLSIDPIFPQLDRALPSYSGIDLSTAIITKFNGKNSVIGSIRSTLERFGWHKGATLDGGMLESFNLLYAEEELMAILEVEGVGAGFGWGSDEKTGRLYVIKKPKNDKRWFSLPQDNHDDRLVKPVDLPEIFLYEMLAAVEKIKWIEK